MLGAIAHCSKLLTICYSQPGARRKFFEDRSDANGHICVLATAYNHKDVAISRNRGPAASQHGKQIVKIACDHTRDVLVPQPRLRQFERIQSGPQERSVESLRWAFVLDLNVRLEC